MGLDTFTLLLSVSLNLTSLNISWIESCIVFYYFFFWLAYFTWLNVLMLKPVSEFPSILRLNDILLYAYIIFYLSVDGHLACFHILTIVNNAAWICVYKYLSQSLLSNGLPLGSFDSVFWCITVLNFDEVNFVCIFFCYLCLQCHLLELIANPISWNLSFFPPSLALTFRFFIHFELTLYVFFFFNF